MKTFGLLITFCFVFFTVNAEAQNKKHKEVVSKTSSLKKIKKTPRTIYFGVINAKALDLVKPEYPQAAIAAKVYGQVSVQVLIDENGNVISAKVSSGHLIFQSVTVKAALESKFETITLSGESVRVSGIIVYKFIPREWNWLEIGFALNNSWSNYYSLESLSETLPVSFQEEKQLLHQLFESSKNYDEITDVVISSISGKLIDDEKSRWLFSVGLILGRMTQRCCRFDEKMERSIEKTKILLQSKPENISTGLISNLEKLILLAENPHLNNHSSTEGNQIYQTLKNLEQKFLYTGK